MDYGLTFFSEFLGTLVLVLLGNGVVSCVVLNKSKGNSAGWIVITTGWGLAVTMAIFVGMWSGAHINPAVSFSQLLLGNIVLSEFFVYVLGQLLGAFVGGIIVFLAYAQQFAATEDSAKQLACFSTGAEANNNCLNCLTEMIGTAVLVLGVLFISDGLAEANMSGLAPMLIGFLVWSIGLSLGGPTGYAINPARDLGPRLAYSVLPFKNKNAQWSYSWVPVVGPLLGSAVAVLIYIVYENLFSI